MLTRPRQLAAGLVVALSVLLAPPVQADTAWEEGFATNVPSSWARESGTPQWDSTNGHPTGGALRASSASYSIARNVGWATSGESVVTLMFKTSSQAGLTGVKMTVDYTAPDQTSTSSVWVAINADGNNGISWGTEAGAWNVYRPDGSLANPQANTYYQLSINMWAGSGSGWPEAVIWWQDEIGSVTYNQYEWQPMYTQLWRIDRVHLEAISHGSPSRNVYVDNVKVREVEAITAPDAPSGVQARMGPDACPDEAGAACDVTPFGDVDTNDIELTWSRPFDGNAPITRYVITRTGASSTVLYTTDTRYVDRDLPFGTYTYSVQAENYKGRSLPSAPANGWSTGLNEVDLVQLAVDSDGDGVSNAEEVAGNSDPTDIDSTPATDDDCDGKANSQEGDMLAAQGIGHPVVSATGFNVSFDPDTLAFSVTPPTVSSYQETPSSCP